MVKYPGMKNNISFEAKGGRATDHIIVPMLVLFALALYIANLGNQYLWQDEAQTALLSMTVTERMMPYGTDGRNFFSQDLGLDYGENHIWKWQTWFSLYVLAAFFKLFGVSTFTARLPFVLFGTATVWLQYHFARRLLGSRGSALCAMLFLMLSIPFILLVRQCKYYSPAIFFTVLALYAYIGIIQKKKHSKAIFITSGFLLFHTHYIYAATLLISVMAHSAVFHRDALRKVGLASMTIAALSAPWAIWYAGIKYGKPYGTVFGPSATFDKAVSFIRQIFEYVLPWFALVIPAGIAALSRPRATGRIETGYRNSWSALALITIFILISIATLSATSPAAFFRYMGPTLPLFAVLLAMIAVSLFKISKPLGVALFTAIILWQPLPQYFHEITHDYDGPIEGIVKFLNEHASPQDTVAITYGDMPLKFYTGLRVVGGLTGEDLSPALSARWIVIRSTVICEKDYAVREYLRNNIDLSKYRLHILPYPDIAFENREDPALHNFSTVKNAPQVKIYERIGDL